MLPTLASRCQLTARESRLMATKANVSAVTDLSITLAGADSALGDKADAAAMTTALADKADETALCAAG